MTVTARLRQFFSRAAEACRDVYTAWREPDAMTAQQRRMDELKIAAGATVTGAGAAELNPVVVAGGIEPVISGLSDMQKAGHEWRAHHKTPPPPPEKTPAPP